MGHCYRIDALLAETAVIQCLIPEDQDQLPLEPSPGGNIRPGDNNPPLPPQIPPEWLRIKTPPLRVALKANKES
ncbi:hypothetical protein IL306_007441 [Fusarium sp. DS 682]|nr:hypothetical protein IL306_007441 [Fusarium sp. DS 682]